MTAVQLCPKRRAAFSISPALSAVTRQKLRLVLGNLGKLAFERVADAGV